jgi:HSP20 family protein
MFEDFSVGAGLRMPRLQERWNGSVWTPKVEAFEKKGQFVVRAELPGLRKEEVKIEATEEGLTLEGERKFEKEEQRDGYYFTERNYGSFYRCIPIPEGANFEKANAVFKDGILEVTIPVPMREEKKARRLEIKS